MANTKGGTTKYSSGQIIQGHSSQKGIKATAHSNWALVTDWAGYVTKPDQTKLHPGALVKYSQNVVTNDGERIQSRYGFTLDGVTFAGSTDKIIAHYDWNDRANQTRTVRATQSGLVQYRSTITGSTVWQTFFTGTANGIDTDWAFTSFYIKAQNLQVLLFSQKTNVINQWSGGEALLASATINTITLQGTTTWAQLGFTATGSVNINGNIYTYTGGTTTTTLTGVAPSPVAEPVNSVIFQVVTSTALTAMTGTATFDTMQINLMSVYNNHLLIGSTTKFQSVYASKVDVYTDFTFASPRNLGDGYELLLDACPTSISPADSTIYISAGNQFWYRVDFQTFTDATTTHESVGVARLKSSGQISAKSQRLTCKISNDTSFVSVEPTFNTLGAVTDIQISVQITNISDPIKPDFNQLNFTGGSTTFWKQFIIITAPTQGLYYIYNLAKGWWEAPQTGSWEGFSVINGLLYGHSYEGANTFLMNQGYIDYNADGDEIPIVAQAVFPYNQYAEPSILKTFDEYITEGYITSDTVLNQSFFYDYGGCGASTSVSIYGNDAQIVCSPDIGVSLGQGSLGIFSLAGRGDDSDQDLPPKFRVIKTANRVDFYELQVSYQSQSGHWELLRHGADVMKSTSTNFAITQ